MNNMIVICTECSEEHDTSEVKFLNIEEDIQGRDIMYFECPVTNLEARSLVYAIEAAESIHSDKGYSLGTPEAQEAFERKRGYKL